MDVLNYQEKQALERILGMSGGYVLNFSNRTFQEFFAEVVGVNIYDERFAYGSGSKANLMRGFWKAADASEVVRLLKGLLDCWEELYSSYNGDGAEKKEKLARIASSVESRFPGSFAELKGSVNLSESRIPNGLRGQTVPRFSDIQFRVALTFSGQDRPYVANIAENLRRELGDDSVFYDEFYTAHLARPDLDIVLTDIYEKRSGLLVVFLSKGYSESMWCGVEWRVVRDIVKRRRGDTVMYVRCDNAPVVGALSIDGYVDATKYTLDDMVKFILQRVG